MLSSDIDLPYSIDWKVSVPFLGAIEPVMIMEVLAFPMSEPAMKLRNEPDQVPCVRSYFMVMFFLPCFRLSIKVQMASLSYMRVRFPVIASKLATVLLTSDELCDEFCPLDFSEPIKSRKLNLEKFTFDPSL